MFPAVEKPTTVEHRPAPEQSQEYIRAELLKVHEKWASKFANRPILARMKNNLLTIAGILGDFRTWNVTLMTEISELAKEIEEYVKIRQLELQRPRKNKLSELEKQLQNIQAELEQLRAKNTSIPPALLEMQNRIKDYYYMEQAYQILAKQTRALASSSNQYAGITAHLKNAYESRELYENIQLLKKQVELLDELFEKSLIETDPAEILKPNSYPREINALCIDFNRTSAYLQQYFELRQNLEINNKNLMETQNTLDAFTTHYAGIENHTNEYMQRYQDQINQLKRELEAINAIQNKENQPQGEPLVKKSSATSSTTPHWQQFSVVEVVGNNALTIDTNNGDVSDISPPTPDANLYKMG